MIETPQARVNVIGTGTSDIDAEGTFHKLYRFSATAQLGHLALRLPISGKGGGYADLGRLDFKPGSTPVAFAFGGFSGPALRSRITLDSGDANHVRIQLDGARLYVAREADMFHGKFHFSGLALTLGRNGQVLVQSTSNPDERPLLRVDLPSQHIKEQAFFKQLPVLPGRELVATELPKLFDLEPRKELQKALRKNDPDFDRFATRYEKAYSEYSNTELPVPAEATKQLEMIYAGREGLFSLRSRRVANELAYKIRSEQGIKLEDVKLGLGPILVADILRRHKPDPQQPWQSPLAQEAFQELLAEAEKRSEDHSIIQKDYRERNPGATTRFYAAAWLDKWPEEYPSLPAVRPDAPKPTRDELSAMLVVIKRDTPPLPDGSQQALSDAYKDEPPNALPVKRKAAGSTRLVFDLSATNKAKPGGKPPTSWHYSLETLLAWDRYELKVTQRAMRFDVDSDSSNTQKLIDGLKSQGINPTTTIDARFIDIVAQASRKPDEFDTRIELPARLYLSPASDARFDQRRAPKVGQDRVPIWQAEMHEVPGKRFSLRAVGSPDFVPGAFNRTAKAPLRGVYDFRSTLDGFDRHQLVGLSSVYGLPVIARQSPTDGLEQTSQVLPPDGYKLADVMDSDKDGQALYVPRPLAHRFLSLSPIGASLDLQAVFVPPASLRDQQTKNLFDAFSVERWRSLISFGRDVTTEVVYKGFLYPIGFRATLVKVTERVFGPWTDQRRFPVAFLRQRLFIQISNPTKKFPAVNQPYDSRGWPAQSMTLDMDHTPDLLDPVGRGDRRSTDQAWTEQGSGRLDHALRVGLVFWPRTSPGEAGNIQFRMKVDERPEPVSMPLIFIDNEAAHDPATMRTLRNYYNDDAQVAPRLKLLQHNGVRRRYAAEEKPGDTTFETLEWRVGADCREERELGGADPDDSQFLMDSPMESVDQPPVYPRLRSALVRHDSSARFSGNAQPPTEVFFYNQYLKRGFLDRRPGDKPDPDSTKQTFFIVASRDAPALEMGSNGDRSGGVGRPNAPIRAIGRDGPIGGGRPDGPPDSATAAPPKFDENFFQSDARVLGIVSLNDLVMNAVADSRVPPLLKDTFEVACEAVQIGAGAASRELIRIKTKIEELPAPFADAYSGLRKSLQQEIDALAPISNACSPSDIARAVATTRNLIGEVDRLSAAPLAPLTSIVDGTLRRTEQDLWAGISGSIEGPLQQIAGSIRLDTISDLLLPIGRAMAAVDRLEKLVAIQPDIAAIFDRATAAAFASTPPPTLQGFRKLWVAQAALELNVLRSQQSPEIVAEIVLLDGVLATFSNTDPPDVLVRLYASAVAVISAPQAAWIDILATQLLGQPFKDELLFWWGRTFLPKCTELVDGAKALRLALVAKEFDPSACKNVDLCVAGKNPPGGGTDGLCLLLWRLCQDLPTLSQQSTELAKAYAALAVATVGLVDVEDVARSKCSNPADLDQIRRDLTRGLHRLVAARDEFVARLLTWAEALGGAAFDRLAQDAVERVGAAAAKALGILAPNAGDLLGLVDQLKPLVGEATAKEIQQKIDATVDRWRAQVSAFTGVANRDDLRNAADQLKTAIAGLAAQAVLDAENALTVAMLRSSLPAVAAGEDVITRVLAALDSGYPILLASRDALRTTVDDLQQQLENTLGIKLTGGRLRDAVNVDVDPALRTVCTGGDVETEGLKQEAATVHCLKQLGAGASRLDTVLNLLRVWSEKDPAFVRLISGLSSRAKQVLSLPPQLQIVDVDELRQNLHELLDDVIPTKRHLAYSWDLPLNVGRSIPIGAGGFAKFILPDKLTLSAATDIDLRQLDKAPTFDVSGRLGSFAIDIISGAVKLHFKPFEFHSGSGRSSHFSADLDHVEIGAMLAFLTILAAYFQAQSGETPTDDGGVALLNGPYVIPRAEGPGIKAGYRLALGAAQIGTLSILGMNFDAHCEMPFDGAKGAVRISLASPEAPFLITCAPYGGRGHFLLESGPSDKGVRFDIGFQWGGAAAISFGPLQGQAFIMIGFRMANQPTGFEFSGFFIAAFEGHVACFGVAGSFVVSLRYVSNRMKGEATLSFEFSCGPTKIEYRVSVGHNAGGSIGDQAWLDAAPGEPRVMFAGGHVPSAVAASCVPALLEDWHGYRKRYDFSIRAAGRRQRR
ncbi:hypothetical protein [Microvirga sp. CF3016]|uniref:hypothetical protein n=1 Tax=Microvirga sp. CF3016 TaxID=3110181 RepID=UPI002E77B801|nr:hypothetical protein [Microvirga sp. CF3016]MEE1611890.1 hypothetical protein [Microvirga sp. CF3016]